MQQTSSMSGAGAQCHQREQSRLHLQCGAANSYTRMDKHRPAAELCSAHGSRLPAADKMPPKAAAAAGLSPCPGVSSTHVPPHLTDPWGHIGKLFPACEVNETLCADPQTPRLIVRD